VFHPSQVVTLKLCNFIYVTEGINPAPHDNDMLVVCIFNARIAYIIYLYLFGPVFFFSVI